MENIRLCNFDEFVGSGRNRCGDRILLHGKFEGRVAHDEAFFVLMIACCRRVDVNLVPPLLQGVSEALDRNRDSVDDGLVDVGEVGDVKFL